MRRIQALGWMGLATAAMLVSISGCLSTTYYGWPGSWAPPDIPSAQNCWTISQSPPRFVCGDQKVYTGRDLQKKREEAAKAVAAAK